jgi:plastocyanin
MCRALAAVAALTLLAAAAALFAPGRAGGENTKLFATVGPSFSIILRDAAGNRVTQLDPGTYDIVVEDLSDEHNFHLFGPGIDRFTTVDEVNTTHTWTVTLPEGRYRYHCDPHSLVMFGTFTVGNPPPPPTPTPTPKKTKLVGTVGPGMKISLVNAAGARVRTVKAGPAAITVRDRSAAHSLHLVAPGVNRKSGVAFKGTRAWTVTLKPGALRWYCDTHPKVLRGAAKIVR